MYDKEALCLFGRFETAHDLLPSSCRPVTTLNSVIETLVSAMICLRCLMSNRLEVTAQFVRDNDPWLAELRDQPCHEAPGSFGIAACLNENVKRVAACIYRTPEPVLHTIDRDHNLVQMPFIIWPGTVLSDAGSEMRTKAINPKTDRLPAHYHTTLGKQILDICCTKCKPMVRPDRIGDNLAWKTKTLQGRHGRLYFHAATRSKVRMRKQLGNAVRIA